MAGSPPRCSTRSSSPSDCSQASPVTSSARWSGRCHWMTGCPPAWNLTAPPMTCWSRPACSPGSPPATTEARSRSTDFAGRHETRNPEAQMRLRPFSSRDRGMFISIDGPSGAGKSTIVRHLAQMLVAAGENVHITAEPSNGPIGVLCRELTESLTGHALACLYAADRYHHLQTEIRPHMASWHTVISDRHIPSGLVMQRFDGIDPAFLWQINAEADRPDLAVILEADPEIIAVRLTAR